MLAGLLSAALVSAPGTTTSTAPVELTLANGLRVVIQTDRRSPLAGVALGLDVGSADDAPDRTGIAHLVEHLAFRRTAQLGEFEVFERVQSAGGRLNAYTAPDETVYWIEAPAERLPEWLWIQREQLGFARPSPSDVDAEKKIVRRELVERDGLFRRLWNIEHRALYPVGERYHPRPNEKRSVGRMSPADTDAFYADYYVPHRAVLAVVSPYPASRVTEWVERYFSSIPATSRSPSAAKPPETRCSGGRIVVRSWLRNPRMSVRWAAPSDVDLVALDVTLELMRRRLHEALVDAGQTPETRYGFWSTKTGAEASLAVELPADERGRDLAGAVDDGLEAIEDMEITEEVVAEVVRAVGLRRHRRWRSPVGRAQWLVSMTLEGRSIQQWSRHLRGIRAPEVRATRDRLLAAPRVDRVMLYDKRAKKERIDGEQVCR